MTPKDANLLSRRRSFVGRWNPLENEKRFGKQKFDKFDYFPVKDQISFIIILSVTLLQPKQR